MTEAQVPGGGWRRKKACPGPVATPYKVSVTGEMAVTFLVRLLLPNPR